MAVKLGTGIRAEPLARLLAQLDQFEQRVPLETLKTLMSEVKVSLQDVDSAVRFGSNRYQRNLLHAGPAYQALILCWRSGQRSPVHDHRGSSCGVRVLTGVATEITFARTPEGFIYPTETRELSEGSVCGSQDDDLHQMSNLQPVGRDLVTLHIYSPPLLRMGMYSLMDSRVMEFVDPVVGLVHGDGI